MMKLHHTVSFPEEALPSLCEVLPLLAAEAAESDDHEARRALNLLKDAYAARVDDDLPFLHQPQGLTLRDLLAARRLTIAALEHWRGVAATVGRRAAVRSLADDYLRRLRHFEQEWLSPTITHLTYLRLVAHVEAITA